MPDVVEQKSSSFLGKVLTGVKGLPRWMWNNKFKTVFLVVLLYASHKLYCFYRDWIKPFMDIKNSVSGSKVDEPIQSVEQSKLQKLIKQSSEEPFRIKIFQTTYQTTR